MKIDFFGDSITVGTYTPIGSTSPNAIVTKGYTHYLAEYFACEEMQNHAINGISYSSTSTVNSAYAIANLIQNVKDAELIFFAGGTNDYGTDVEIGNADDAEDISFYGALNIAFKTAKENNPNAEIYVLSPIPRLNENQPNKKGYVLDDYRNALQVKTAEYGFFFIDGSLLEIYPYKAEDKNAYILDGTHLNEAGHQKLAELIIKSIENK